MIRPRGFYRFTPCIPVAAILTLFFLIGQAHANADKYCRIPATNTFLFVDITTEYTPRETKALIAGLKSIYLRARAGDRITIYSIEDHFSRSQLLFRECKPGCLDGESWFDASCSKLRMKRREIPAFESRLAGALTGILKHKSAPRSDILMTLNYALRGHRFDKSDTIYLFSDMIDNVVAGSLLKTLENTSKEALVETIRHAGWSLELNRATVVIFGFGHRDTVNTTLDIGSVRRLEAFWRDLFLQSGAGEVHFQLTLIAD